MPRPPAGKQKKPKKNPFGDVEEEEPKPRKLTAEERRAEKAAEREEEEQWMGERAPRRAARGGDEDDEDDELPADLARKISQQSRLQREEVEVEQRAADVASAVRPSAAAADDSDDDDDDGGGGGGGDSDEDEDEAAGGDEYYDGADDDELALGDSDRAALDAALGSERVQTLADVILAKIREKAAQKEAGGVGGGAASAAGGAPSTIGASALLPPKVLEVYRGVGKLLHTYRSGKLPKAFKIVPRLANWEEVLYVTQPEAWTPAATRAATRLCASNMKPKQAQRFYSLVLLPAVQDDIAAHKRLNFHLYLALKKALYKPAAFFKGVLLPLAEARATLREALIVGSVLSKVSGKTMAIRTSAARPRTSPRVSPRTHPISTVPMLHSAVAILKLAEMEYSGASALFMRVLLLKKYALPYRVVDALVDYFTAFGVAPRGEEAPEMMPLLWHQCLLAFAQHYKAELTNEQKERFKMLLRVQEHGLVTPDIRRELFSGRSRGDPYLPPLAGGSADMVLG